MAAELEGYMKRCGAEALSFDTIVASGYHSAMPHAAPSAKKIEAGDFVTMDYGCKYNGYCSDMTRTVVVGKASEKQKEIYNIVLEAQLTSLAAVQPGKPGPRSTGSPGISSAKPDTATILATDWGTAWACLFMRSPDFPRQAMKSCSRA